MSEKEIRVITDLSHIDDNVKDLMQIRLHRFCTIITSMQIIRMKWQTHGVFLSVGDCFCFSSSIRFRLKLVYDIHFSLDSNPY